MIAKCVFIFQRLVSGVVVENENENENDKL
jgi:hypothetical protein